MSPLIKSLLKAKSRIARSQKDRLSLINKGFLMSFVSTEEILGPWWEVELGGERQMIFLSEMHRHQELL
jgi:hypothetical protein